MFGNGVLDANSHVHVLWVHVNFSTQVILFDLASGYSRLSGWRKELWEFSHIGIPDNDQESKDAIVFGYLTYWFISQVHVHSNVW